MLADICRNMLQFCMHFNVKNIFHCLTLVKLTQFPSKVILSTSSIKHLITFFSDRNNWTFSRILRFVNDSKIFLEVMSDESVQNLQDFYSLSDLWDKSWMLFMWPNRRPCTSITTFFSQSILCKAIISTEPLRKKTWKLSLLSTVSFQSSASRWKESAKDFMVHKEVVWLY